MAQRYRIWSHEHGAWWKQNQHGYTSDKKAAGVFNEEDAMRICDSANIIEEMEEMILVEDD